MVNRLDKLKISLRYYLQGAADIDASYRNPLDAFDFALQTHVGLRKDGKTPEVSHQIETTLFLRTLRPLMGNPAKTLSVMLLHDAMEDYGISFDEFETRFGPDVAHGVLRMSKVREGNIKISSEQYFEEMLDCPLATICKGSDRIHNQNSMVGVFTTEKQKQYIEETEEFILPMLKRARRVHAHQEAIYENLKFVLKSQISLLKSLHNSTNKG